MTGTSLFPSEPGPAVTEAILTFSPRIKLSGRILVEFNPDYDLLWWELPNNFPVNTDEPA